MSATNTPEAQRAIQARKAARAAGQPTFRGQPCVHGHSGLRLTSNKSCVECRAQRPEHRRYLETFLCRNTLLAMLYPEEFDNLGWRRLAVKEAP